jgi:hypothetical protein
MPEVTAPLLGAASVVVEVDPDDRTVWKGIGVKTRDPRRSYPGSVGRAKHPAADGWMLRR